MLAWLTVLLFGIVQGITEWLPVSSTGHMILLEALLPLDVSDDFLSLFRVVIQLGSITAVLFLYGRRLDPRTRAGRQLWILIFIAALPAALCGLLLDDFLDAHLYNPPTVAAALIFYGVAFILMEKRRAGIPPRAGLPLTPARALGVGCFQVLALIPGTSRSGSTILGASLLGLDRTTAAEFSFFLAIPTMVGASALKGCKLFLTLAEKNGGSPCTGREWAMLALASAVALAVSLCAIRFLLDFVKRHSFAAFGIYRIALGCAVFAAYALGGIA